MKKFTKVLSLCLALVMALSLAACAGDTPAPSTNPPAPSTTPPAADNVKDWTGFHGWLEEDWDSKEISYQFTGYWDMGDPAYGKAFSFLMNLYNDGSVLVNQYQTGKADYRYFGSWELVKDPDGDELDITIVEETDEAGDLIDHKYSYVLYEESDGGFSFGYDFGIAAGQYFRVADMTGSKNVTYTSIAAFQAAADAAAPAAGDTTEPAGDTTEPAGDVVATYEAGSLVLTLYADGTMRVEFPQYSMSRDGFTYELSEDGTTLTVTDTPSEEDMGAFAQVWKGAGADVWTIDGTTATPAE